MIGVTMARELTSSCMALPEQSSAGRLGKRLNPGQKRQLYVRRLGSYSKVQLTPCDVPCKWARLHVVNSVGWENRTVLTVERQSHEDAKVLDQDQPH